MTYPKELMKGSGKRIGIIVGGHDKDPASDHSCNQRVYFPMEHGNKVKKEHLALSTMSHSPTNHSQQSFPGCLDPGTLVFVESNLGENQCMIIGQANDLHNSKSTPGNIDLMKQLTAVSEALSTELKINIAPNYEEKEDDGTKIREVKEKGQKHSHNLLKGLPTHGANFSMAGLRLPELKQIPTAIEKFSGLQTNDMMNQLPGNLMSMGQMFQGLMGGGTGSAGGMSGAGSNAGGGGGGGTSGGSGSAGTSSVGTGQFSVSYANTRMDNILSALPNQEMRDALTSFAIHAQGGEGGGALGSFGTAARVDPVTYLDNAEQLLSQCQTVGDLMTCMHQLQWDTSLFGQENLAPVAFTYDSGFGPMQQMVYANAYVAVANTGNTGSQMSNFGSNMGSSQQSPGGGGGSNMFGQASGKVMDMIQRMAPNAEKHAKNAMQDMQGGIMEKVMKIAKTTVSGGIPIDFNMFG